MLASAVHHNESAVGSVSVLSAFLRHLNTGTLALALFISFAVLNATQRKEPDTRVSAYGRGIEPGLTLAPCDPWVPAHQEVRGGKFIAKDFGNKVARNQ